MKAPQRKISDITTRITNGFVGPTRDIYIDSGIPYLLAKHVKHNRLNFDGKTFITEEFNQKCKKSILKEGDVLLVQTGHIGESAVVPKTHEGHNCHAMIVISPIKEMLDGRYLSYFFNSPEGKAKIIQIQTGATLKHLNCRDIRDVTLPLPSLSKQRHIADILDKADSLREHRRQAIAKLDELLKSIFLDMFGDPVTNLKGWPKVTIRDLVSEVNYGTSSKAGEQGQFPILRMNNITYTGGWNFSDLKYIDLTEKEHSKYLVQRGDLLFNRTNSKELVGKTAVYRRDESMAIAGYLIRVRGNEECNTEYLSGFLNSNYGKLTLLNMCKSIIGMANINAQELQSIPILKPPKKLQDEFASIVSKIEANKETLKTSLEKTNSFFTTLQQRAFTGELFPEESTTPTQPLLEVAQHV